MVDGGKVTLRFEIDNEQFKRVLQEINKDLDKFKQKATEAGTSVDSLGGNLKKTGEQSASAAVNFQTLTQGAINLTTSFAQTYASVSNIQRAHTSLAQSMVSLDRAEDQLERKQFKLNQEMAKAAPNMAKIALLQNEISTAMDDYAVKQQKVKDTQDQLNDTQMLFAVNLVNVGFSAIQTAKSMHELVKNTNLLKGAMDFMSSSMGKVALIATAIIIAMEGVVLVARAMNVEWADQIPSISNLGKKINETFTTSDQILAKSKKGVEEYGQSYKDLTETVKTESKKQSDFVIEHERRIQEARLQSRKAGAINALKNYNAPRTGANAEKDIGIWGFPVAYGAVSGGRISNSNVNGGGGVDVTSWFRENDRMIRARQSSGLGGDIGIVPYGQSYGNPIEYNKEYFSNPTVDDYGRANITEELKAEYNSLKLKLLELPSLNIIDELKDFIEAQTELRMFEIEGELMKLGVSAGKSGGPNLATLTPNTSFKAISNSELANSFAESAKKQYALAAAIKRQLSFPMDKNTRRKLEQDYFNAKVSAKRDYKMGMSAAVEDFLSKAPLGTARNVMRILGQRNIVGAMGTNALNNFVTNLTSTISSFTTTTRNSGVFQPIGDRFANMTVKNPKSKTGVSTPGQYFRDHAAEFSSGRLQNTRLGIFQGNAYMTSRLNSTGFTAAGYLSAKGSGGLKSAVSKGGSQSKGRRGGGAGRHDEYQLGQFANQLDAGYRSATGLSLQELANMTGLDIGVTNYKSGVWTVRGNRIRNYEQAMINRGNAINEDMRRKEQARAELGRRISFYSQLPSLGSFDPDVMSLLQAQYRTDSANFEIAINRERSQIQSQSALVNLSVNDVTSLRGSFYGHDELLDRIRFSERLEKISSGGSSL